MHKKLSNPLILSGLIATIGAFLVGVGEFTFQYAPGGDYTDPSYGYFRSVSDARLTVGHFLGVLVAPAYLVGYWHVGQMLKPAGLWLSRAVFFIGAYAFMIGNVWLGGRVDLALGTKALAVAPPDAQTELQGLLTHMAEHNEPLINIVRVLVLALSVLMAWGILSNRSLYPRPMVLALPFTSLAAIFALYFIVPAIGGYLLPAAMNVAHVVFFGFSLRVAHLAQANGSNSFYGR